MFENLRNATTPTQSAQAILDFARSPWTVAWTLEIVARGIPDLLRNGPQDVDTIARASRSHPRTLYRVLRVLAGVGFFEERTGQEFALTTAGRLLCADDPLSQRDGLLLTREDFYRRLIGRIPEMLTTGESGFELEYGEPLFQHVRTNAHVARSFDAAMTCLTRAYAHSILEAYDFTGVRTLVDLGCGQGALAFSLIERVPSITTATLLDLPHVIVAAKRKAVAAGIEARCHFIGASYFEPDVIPAGADLYLLKHNCHDHGDEEVIRILGNVRRALRPGGRVLLIDGVMPPPNEYSPLLGMELAGLALLPGTSRERSRAEWLELVAAANLKVLNSYPTGSDLSLIEITA